MDKRHYKVTNRKQYNQSLINYSLLALWIDEKKLFGYGIE
ncbi:hypothetical protein BTN50_0044 [Candidatus Enterovibrio altilux]|uniref:Uncharacterized protein n=1 Tax=Candidatus Enterovibrio altilux TaxID=1927128 RepID=A0A291B6G8_9GAMM|nr:hypothetical protein BTN50_0044 [Candidatus Enterovibrio luxaltus]